MIIVMHLNLVTLMDVMKVITMNDYSLFHNYLAQAFF